MKRRLAIRFFLGVVSIVVLAILFLRSAVAGDIACRYARQVAPKLFGIPLQVGYCRVDPLHFSVELAGVSVPSPGSDEPLFAVDRAEIRLRPVQAFSGRFQLERVELDHPRVRLDLSQPGPPGPSKGKNCAAGEALDRVEIGDLEIDSGVVAVTGRSGGFSMDGVNIRAAYRTTSAFRRGNYDIAMNAGAGEVRTGSGTVPLKLEHAVLHVAPRGRDLEGSITVDTDAGKVSVSGVITDLCNPSFDGSVNAELPVAALAPMMGAAGAGRVRVAAALKGSGQALSAEVKATTEGVTIAGFVIGDTAVDARLDPQGHVFLDRVEVPFGKGLVKVRGELSLKDKMSATFDADVRDLPFGPLMGRLTVPHAWVEMTNSGKIHLTGHLAHGFTLSGDATASVSDFAVRDHGWDLNPPNGVQILDFRRADVVTGLSVNSERVHIANAKVSIGGATAQADVTLNFDLAKGLRIAAQVVNLNLDTLRHIAGVPLAGHLDATATISGPYAAPVIDGNASARDARVQTLSLGAVTGPAHFEKNVLSFPGFTALKGRSVYSARGALDFNHSDGLWVEGTGSVDHALFSDLIDTLGDTAWYLGMWRDHAEGRVSGTVSVSGPVFRTTSQFDLGFDDMELIDRPWGHGSLKMRIEDGARLAIDELILGGASGTLEISGGMAFAGSNDFHFSLERAPLAVLAMPEGEWMKLEGTLGMRGTIYGTPEHPRGDAVLAVSKIVGRGIPVGDGHFTAHLNNTTLTVEGTVGPEVPATLTGTVQLPGENPFEATVSATVKDFFRFGGAGTLPNGFESLSADAEGTVHVKGHLLDVSTWSGDLSLSSLRLALDDVSARNLGPVRATFAGDAWAIQALRLKGVGTDLQLSGSREASGKLDLLLHGSVDAQLVAGLYPPVETSSGALVLDANVRGTTMSPLIDGRLDIKEGEFSLRDFPISARALHGAIEINRGRIVASRLTGVLNDGRMELNADVQLLPPSQSAGWHLGSTWLGLFVDEASFRWQNWPTVTVSRRLELCDTRNHDEDCGERATPAPSEASYQLAGDLEIDRFRYTREIQPERTLLDLRKHRVELSPGLKQKPILRLNVGLQAKQSMEIDNNLARVTLSGQARLTGTDVHPGLIGELSAPQGGRATLYGNQLEITHAEVAFKDKERVVPEFDIFAQGQVRENKVFIHAFGTPDDWRTIYTSEPPLPQGDIISLLILGVTARDKNASLAAGTRAVGQILLEQSGLDRAVRNYVGSTGLVRDVKGEMSTIYSDISGQVEPTASFEAKVLSDKLKLRLQQPVNEAKGTRVQAEYVFDEGGGTRPATSLQGSWDNDTANTSLGGNFDLGNFGLDLTLHWKAR
jgi:translocation and assembly module TamB